LGAVRVGREGSGAFADRATFSQRGARTGSMSDLLDLKTYETYVETAWTWLAQNAVALGISGLAQLLVVGLAFLVARQGAARTRQLLDRVARGWRYGPQL